MHDAHARGCQWCGQPFAATRAHARYCSTSHRVAASRDRRRTEHALHALDTARHALRQALARPDAATAAAIRTVPLDGNLDRVLDRVLAEVRRDFASQTTRRGGQPAHHPRKEH